MTPKEALQRDEIYNLGIKFIGLEIKDIKRQIKDCKEGAKSPDAPPMLKTALENAVPLLEKILTRHQNLLNANTKLN